ncbi:hypothetical protein F4821DRAFT_3340 [Hypoxylon rubiginosum]|uniref:Uncharacterized protein n=1 Tax=Hypoxylon rubiginosum TaxID=110542 RepID=A0ACC0DMC1_9PEZI|nr:hypothetical protein F4821DRAFT_3340 [Hypoxylon rubiginosum]
MQNSEYGRASPYVQPLGPQSYGGYFYRPQHEPPSAQGSPKSYLPPPQQCRPPPPALFLKRESDISTLSLHGPDGRPLYHCVHTNRPSVSSKPDCIITHEPSGADVGSIRYHHWLSAGLDYWEVHGERGGSNLWAWRLEYADTQHTQWACYHEADLAGGWDPADCTPAARMTFGWAANKPLERDSVIGRCDIFDVGLLLNPARRNELDEFYTTAVVVIDGAFKARARAKKTHGSVGSKTFQGLKRTS